MTWQEWLGGLLMLLGFGGVVILLAEMLCGWLKLDRKRPEPQEFEEPAESGKSFGWVRSQAQRLRQIETAAANAADPLANVDAYFAQVDAEITAEAAAIAKRCEVRR